jgi:hypothetical protein
MLDRDTALRLPTASAKYSFARARNLTSKS